MRDIEQVNWLYMDMQELAKITKEVYGIPFDIQMRERSQGSYEIVNPHEPFDEEGYHTGLKKDGYRDYPDHEDATWTELTDEEAIARWVAVGDTSDWHVVGFSPFDVRYLNEVGEYIWYQPSIHTVLADLIKKGEIPDGEYFIDIDW